MDIQLISLSPSVGMSIYLCFIQLLSSAALSLCAWILMFTVGLEAHFVQFHFFERSIEVLMFIEDLPSFLISDCFLDDFMLSNSPYRLPYF